MIVLILLLALIVVWVLHFVLIAPSRQADARDAFQQVVEGCPDQVRRRTRDLGDLQVVWAESAGSVIAIQVQSRRLPSEVFIRKLDDDEETWPYCGDAVLEREVKVWAGPVWTQAVLDAPTRERIRSLMGRGRLTVVKRRVSLDTSTERPAVGGAEDLIEDLVELARRLSSDEPLDARLRRIALEDPQPQVSLAAASELLDCFPDSEAARELLEQAVHHEDPEMRFLAAQHRGDGGTAELIDLIASDGDDELRIRAIEYGLAEFPEQLPEVLIPLLDSAVGEVRAAAIQGLVSLERGEIEPHLVSLLRSDHETERAAILGLGALGGPEHEPLLIPLLEQDHGLLVVTALGRIGTSESRAALLALSESTPRVEGGEMVVMELLERAMFEEDLDALDSFLEVDQGLSMQRAIEVALRSIEKRMRTADP